MKISPTEFVNTGT